MDDIQFLQQLAAFATLTEEEAKELIQGGVRKNFEPGERILKKGDPGDSMAIILQGSVRVPVTDEEGTQRFVAYLGPGDFFGEMALLTGERRGADVLADGEIDVICLVLDRDIAVSVMKKNPRLARFLTEILGKRLLESGQMRTVGKYHIMGEIGRGGGGIVYEGFHKTLHRSVAIKMLSHELIYEGDFAERFQIEAQTVADLRHENIVQVYDCEAAYATFFIVMEKLTGSELSDLVADSPLQADEARHILRQVTRALQYAHKQRIVHQDVKLTNVFVEDTGRIKLMDFGIASAQKNVNSDRNDGVMGTPGYIAPEVLRGLPIDGRADIYALGIVAYEMLVGKSPFKEFDKLPLLREQLDTPFVTLPDDVKSSCEQDLINFIEQATQRKSDQRPKSCGEILKLLDDETQISQNELQARSLTVLFEENDRTQVDAVLEEIGMKLKGIRNVKVLRGDLSE
ncbi:MAG: protein kinase [Deltaproteobacteria bacterium]|nr:protein kinase [Deltaproteobacteria bacterium]